MIEFRQKSFSPVALAKGAQMLSKAGGLVVKDIEKGGMMTSTAVGLGGNAALSSSGNKIQREMQTRQEQMAKEQDKARKRIEEANRKAALEGQKMAAKATNNLAKAVKKGGVNGNGGGMPAQGLTQFTPTIAMYSETQKIFAAPNPNFLKRVGNVTYDFARALNNTGKGNNIQKKLAQGLAIGATMTATSGIADKLIQLDRKRITGGAPLPRPEENPEEKKKKRKKKLIKAGATAAAVTGTIIAARKGALGKGWQSVANKPWKSTVDASGKTITKGWQDYLKAGEKDFWKSTKENFVPGKGEGSAGWLGPGFTFLFPAVTVGSYALGERKQLKDQANQQEQKQYSEEQPRKKKGSVLKKAVIGTTLAVGTIAAGRRGAFGAKAGRYLNDWYMSRGGQINRLGQKVNNGFMKNTGDKMVNSGSVLWDKFNRKVTDKGIVKATNKLNNAKAGKRNIFQRAADLFKDEKGLAEAQANRVAKREEKLADIQRLKGISGTQRAKDVLSGKTHTSFTKSILGSKPVRFITFQEGNNQQFLKELEKNHTKNGKLDDTGKVARFLTTGTGQTLAGIGAVGVGLAAMKPFEWGDKAVRAGAKAIDKDAFAYEKSKEQQV